MISLFIGVAAMSIGLVSASTTSTLIAAELNGPSWSGVPGACGVLGTGLGALLSGTMIARRGKRFALITGYTSALVGAMIVVTAAHLGALVVLMAGMLLLGLGNGGAQLSRYLAAELYPEQRKGSALSAIVWAGTVGALVGPALIDPAADTAGALTLPPLSGPPMISGGMVLVALLASTCLPRIAERTRGEPGPGPSLSRMRAALTTPIARLPLAAMVAAQMAMVAVMTMTPVQLDEQGHGLDVVGWVLSAHMIGMFALAPLSGRIADRFGGRATIFCGTGTLILAATVAIAAPTAHQSGLPIALFLLGYGWNLSIVGGSTLLSRGLPAEQRAQSQGTIDALVWSSAALASVLSGQLFGAGGYVLVAGVAGVLVLLPLALGRAT